MTELTLFFGDSAIDERIRCALKEWSAGHPQVTLKYVSIHDDPVAVVRLGITELPALVFEGTIIAQGEPERWISRLLHWIVAEEKLGI